MSWQSTKTWAAGPWTFSDANTYLRDNLQTMRKYQQNQEGMGFKDAGVTTVGTVANGFAQNFRYFNLMPKVADEACTLSVFYGGQVYSAASGATVMSTTIYNDLGVAQSTLIYTITQEDFGAVAIVPIAAGQRPGYWINCVTDTGTCSMYLASLWVITPNL